MIPANDDERSARLIAVFNAAKLRAPGEEREAFLAEACGAKAILRSEVDELLRAHDDLGSFLNGGDAISIQLEAEFARLKPEEPGDRIGHYKLLQQIGEGGFGTVWMAEQDQPVKRRVALKIIKLGMDTKEVVARFEQERQALAMMDHPNIARVFDAGVTPTGRPFFVMELVRGIKITDYCDEQALSTEERVELFIQVCHAVQHAHQKGIIHRDLKPSNILITINDGEPVPKVIDFGVAKATQGRLSEATLFTKFEQMIGTPLYMSPEQAEMTSLDIDTRSDIFSLGVLLYELLTGRTPIDTTTMAQAGMDEIRRIIREVDPPRPSARVKTLAGNELTTAAKRRHTDAAKLPRSLRGDIDWIVMKCLEKDRKRRYETATGLAADLQRHLRNEVVIARPPTTAYLLGKLIKRNKLAFAAGTAVAVSLLIGMGATAWQLVQTRAAEQRAVAAFDELRKTAPAFAEQARALASKERYDEAIEKLNYASQLRPDVADYLLAKADLLQAQQNLAAAAATYREALRVKPGHARAEASAKLCDELLAAKPGGTGKLSRESLARLYVTMQQQQRPAAELVPIARLLGEEKKLLVDYWLARLKDLPIAGEKRLEERLTVREDGQLALDLSGTKVVDLSPLSGAPLATLNAAGCTWLKDISPLRGTRLVRLDISGTPVTDLTPLREMHSLTDLVLSGSHVVDLSPISALRLKRIALADCAVSDVSPLASMLLEEITLRGTRVSELSPLDRMPIKSIDLTNAPVLDFSALAKLPLEKCYLQRNRITDLSIFRGKPLKELVLWACVNARNYSVLREIETLELLLLPAEYRGLPADDYAAIGALRKHPKLRQIGSEIMGGMGYAGTGSKELFWRDWDREQAFVPRLRQAGVPFFLTKNTSGNYAVFVQQQKGFRDLSIFSGAPLEELHVATCDISNLTPLKGLQLRILSIAYNPVVDLGPLKGMPLEHLSASGTKAADLTPLIGAPLKRLFLDRCESITDLGVLTAIPTLEQVTIPVGAPNVERLRELPKLRDLSYQLMNSAPFDPSTSAEQFWKDYEANGWIARLVAAGWKPRELKRVNDGFWDLDLDSPSFSDLSLLKGAPISKLRLRGTAVSNLSPLRGMPLTLLFCGRTGVVDLEPLRGMPLRDLTLTSTRVSDLGPLQGMQLATLDIGGTKVSDISVLRGMPLTALRLHGCTALTDLSPISETRTLASITLPPNATNLEFLRRFPKLQRIGFEETSYNNPDKTAAEFWNEYDNAGWLRKLQASGFKINKAKRLPDGTWDIDLQNLPISSLEPLRGAPISKLHLGLTAVTDLGPLRGMPLKVLWIYNTKVTDLSPLAGMPLEYLHLGELRMTDISALRGMPLHTLWLHGTKVTDLSPLAETTSLTTLTIPPTAENVAFLRAFPRLESLSYKFDLVNRRTATTAKEFWQEYDQLAWLRSARAAGLTPKSATRLPDGTWEVDFSGTPIADLEPLRGAPIANLKIANSEVRDLSPLKEAPLRRLWVYNTKVTDLGPLRGMKLTELHVSQTLVTDISVVHGMPLTMLRLHGCKALTDLSPLADLKELESLTIPEGIRDIEFLRKLPALKRLAFWETKMPDGKMLPAMAAEFWAARDGQAWLKALREAGITPRRAAPMDDGTWDVKLDRSSISSLEILRGARISQLDLGNTVVADLSPLRGMPLKALWIFNTKVTDLSPLAGMPLEYLHVGGTRISDLSALRGMPLTRIRLHACALLTDLSPLADSRALIEATIPEGAKNIEFLRAFPKLERISYWETKLFGGGPPDKSAEEFWKEYDAAKN